MNEPVTIWRFIRRYCVRIVIGAVLVAMVYGAISIYATYQREQRIARQFDGIVEGLLGRVGWGYSLPKWVPHSIQDRMPFLDRIEAISLHDTPESLDVASAIGTLTNLKYLDFRFMRITDAWLEPLKNSRSLIALDLSKTRITDTGLESLKGLTNLKKVVLSDTQVTDAGLAHLKGLTNLTNLDLDGTRTTPEGRAMLRTALPKCDIEPDP